MRAIITTTFIVGMAIGAVLCLYYPRRHAIDPNLLSVKIVKLNAQDAVFIDANFSLTPLGEYQFIGYEVRCGEIVLTRFVIYGLLRMKHLVQADWPIILDESKFISPKTHIIVQTPTGDSTIIATVVRPPEGGLRLSKKEKSCEGQRLTRNKGSCLHFSLCRTEREMR